MGTQSVHILVFLHINSIVVEKDFPVVELYCYFVTPKEIMDQGDSHPKLLTSQKGDNQIQLPNGRTTQESLFLNTDTHI